MKKINYTITLIVFIILISCDKNDDSDINNNSTSIISKSSSKLTINHKDSISEFNNSVNADFNQPVVIDLNYGRSFINGGCTQRVVTPTDTYLSNDYYGPTAVQNYQGYVIRGFGMPHHVLSYNCLALSAFNWSRTAISRGNTYQSNSDKMYGSAISIEYAFEQRITYEIKIRGEYSAFEAYINGEYVSGDGSRPTLYVELADSPEISGPDPCAKLGVNTFETNSTSNIYRKSTIDTAPGRGTIDITFNFSPTQQKSALVISLHPKLLLGRVSPPVKLNNNHIMTIRDITITKRTYNPTYNNPPRTEPSGPRSPIANNGPRT